MILSENNGNFFLPDIYNCFVILFVLLSWLEPKVNENGDGYNPFLFFILKRIPVVLQDVWVLVPGASRIREPRPEWVDRVN